MIGPNADYRDELLEDGGLGDSDVFQHVVARRRRRCAILFVNFDAGGWLAELARTTRRSATTSSRSTALGLSAWVDDDVAHAVLRVTDAS